MDITLEDYQTEKRCFVVVLFWVSFVFLFLLFNLLTLFIRICLANEFMLLL